MVNKRFVETLIITMMILLALAIVLILISNFSKKDNFNKEIKVSESSLNQAKLKQISPSPEIYHLSKGGECDCQNPKPLPEINVVPWENNQNQGIASPL